MSSPRVPLVVFVAQLAVGFTAAFGGATAAGQGPAPLADLQRARERVPRAAWKGADFAEMSSKLTGSLRRAGHRVRPCSEWQVDELKSLRRRLLREADADLLAIYDGAGDNRRQRFSSLDTLERHWGEVDAAVSRNGSPGLHQVRRDGLCHEVVMAWAHHLPSSAQKRLTSEGLQVPSLPNQRHASADHGRGLEVRDVLVEYAKQVSCQQCHTGMIADPAWQNASLPLPLPIDQAHPGLERKRSCDYQSVPPCGPCDGLGGPRTGDGVEEMVAMPCEVLSGAETSPTTHGRYPSLATVNITGDTRFPLAVRPEGKGHYVPIAGTLALGWEGDFMRMRYDFTGLGAQVSVQTMEQARKQDVGASLGLSAASGKCVCEASIAGNMHVQSFEASDPLDPLRLPADQGGAAYLGRVRVQLDGSVPQSNRTAVADHYMKWAFHFLVDAEESSPSFGLPLRLYGPYGVRQVFEGWRLGDPAQAKPEIWKMPAGCEVKAPACSVFERAAVADEQEERQLVV